MGKLDVATLPIAKQNNIDLLMPETQQSFEMVNLKNRRTLPDDTEFFGNQVAGHKDKEGQIGMLKCDGTVLKPVTKAVCGDREVAFYEELDKTTDRSLQALKQFVPTYYGTKTVHVDGEDVRCIELEDLTSQYMEPCIMDCKIGRRTWDPLASYEKIVNELNKYKDCKNELGFCIPGFQVHRISNGKLCKYGKDYGKRLNKDSLLNAVKIFLNADVGLCRNLLVQVLTHLWRILHWSRNQRRLRIYASSILIVYDARRLKECLKLNKPVEPRPELVRRPSLYRPLSLAQLNNSERVPTGFSGQLTPDGPILQVRRRSKVSPEEAEQVATRYANGGHPWQKSIRNLKRTHSFQNDYDKDVQSKKQDYRYMLDGLMTEKREEIWATVKMIDFAHVFVSDEKDVDRNYLEGLENLVKLFEDLLMQTDAML